MPILPKGKRRPWQPERKMQGRRTRPNSKFYHSPEWRKLRAVKIGSNPLCEICARGGTFTVAGVVDHIVPINKGGEPLDLDNLQSLCKNCHNAKSGREAHQREK